MKIFLSEWENLTVVVTTAIAVQECVKACLSEWENLTVVVTTAIAVRESMKACLNEWEIFTVVVTTADAAMQVTPAQEGVCSQGTSWQGRSAQPCPWGQVPPNSSLVVSSRRQCMRSGITFCVCLWVWMLSEHAKMSTWHFSGLSGILLCMLLVVSDHTDILIAQKALISVPRAIVIVRKAIVIGQSAIVKKTKVLWNRQKRGMCEPIDVP